MIENMCGARCTAGQQRLARRPGGWGCDSTADKREKSNVSCGHLNIWRLCNCFLSSCCQEAQVEDLLYLHGLRGVVGRT
jgi:hypothetical protein